MMILEFAISRPQLVASCYYNTLISQSASKKEILSRLLDLILKTFQLYKNLSSFLELFLNLVSNLSKCVYYFFEHVLFKSYVLE